MYNANTISSFIEKVNREAEAAANQVFEKYQSEFERKVLAQMKVGDRLIVGNGTAVFSGNVETDAMDKFAEAVSDIQYLEQHAGFDINDFVKA